MHWNRLIRNVCSWADRTFPTDRDSLVAKAKHLREETDELIEELKAPRSMWRRLRVADELADIFIMAFHIAHCEEIDAYQAIKTKLETVKTREWLPPDADGVIRHKK